MLAGHVTYTSLFGPRGMRNNDLEYYRNAAIITIIIILLITAHDQKRTTVAVLDHLRLVVLKIICAGRAFAKITRFL